MNAPMSQPQEAEGPPPPRRTLTSLIDAAEGPPFAQPNWPAPKGHRGGMVTLAAELRTARVRQFHRREFAQLSEWLVALERARAFRAVGAARIDAAQAIIVRHLAAQRHAFDAAAQHADTLLAEQGLGDIPIDYLQPSTLAVPILDPLARNVLQLLLAADDAFASVERAWLMGLLDTPQRRAQEAIFRRRLRETKAVVREQHVQVGRLLRQHGRETSTNPPGQPAAGQAGAGDEGQGPGREPQCRAGPCAQPAETRATPAAWWEGQPS